MKIKIDSQLKPTLTVIENFDGKTFGELKPILIEQGVYTEGMKVIVGNVHTTLEVDSAILPDLEEIILFITPRDTKAGSIDKIISALGKISEELNSDEEDMEISEEEKTPEMDEEVKKIRKELMLQNLRQMLNNLKTQVIEYSRL